MPAVTPHRGHLARAVKTALRSSPTLLKAEVGAVPSDIVLDDDKLPQDGYVIIYPLDTVKTHETLCADRFGCRTSLQLTSVGGNFDQCAWVAERALQALLTRSTNGTFTLPITASDVAVLDRDLASAGRPEPSGGGLWQAVDIIDLEVLSA